jgi:hypothetical protein
MTGGSHTRLQTVIRIRKYKTTRAALLRLGEPRRHSALGSGLCLPKASMAQYYASDETEIAWTMHSSTGEFSGCARRSLITVRNGACPSCRQGAVRSGRQSCAEHSPVGTYHDPLALWHPRPLAPIHRRGFGRCSRGESSPKTPVALPLLALGTTTVSSLCLKNEKSLPYSPSCGVGHGIGESPSPRFDAEQEYCKCSYYEGSSPQRQHAQKRTT